MVVNITEIHYEYEDENPLCHSEDGKSKYLQQTLKLMNDFLLLVSMSYVVSRFKLLRMSWYISMKPLKKTEFSYKEIYV